MINIDGGDFLMVSLLVGIFISVYFDLPYRFIGIVVVNYLSLKALRLPPTIPKDLVAQHIPEQERENVVGSALKGPVYQGQPVNPLNGVKTNIDFATITRGTIHLNPEDVEFSLPHDPGAIIIVLVAIVHIAKRKNE